MSRFTDEEETKLYQIARTYIQRHGNNLIIVVYADRERPRRDWEDETTTYYTQYNYHVSMQIRYTNQRTVRVVAHHKGSANVWHTFRCGECEYDLKNADRRAS